MNNKKISASTWAQRAQAELGAQKRFQHLIKEFVDHKIKPKIIRLAVEAYNDERKHALICADIARNLGHETGYELPDGSERSFVKPWAHLKDSRKKLVLDMVFMCCITETINASLLNTLYAYSKKSELGKILNQIFKDEVKHGKLGWAFLSAESKINSCGYISEYLPEMFELAINDDLLLPIVTHEANQSDLLKKGVLPVSYRREQFNETFITVILPAFNKFNIDTRGAKSWHQNKKWAKTTRLDGSNKRASL